MYHRMTTIPLFKVFMSRDVGEPLLNTLYSGMITQGQQVENFEAALRTTFDYPYVVTLNSATSGLTMAIRMIQDEFEQKGVPMTPDCEVLSSPLTCMATNIPILANGMKIRWVDVDAKTGLLDLADLESKINNNTRIIMFVHWGGFPLDMDALNAVLDRKEKEMGFRPQIIEDCAHAFLSEYKGKKLGTSGNYSVFSLQAIKHLTTGDGGLLMCPNEQSYEKAKLLRWYGIDRNKRNYKGKDFRLEADVADWGYKFHMNDVNATIGLYNLPHIAGLIEKNRANAKAFDAHINNPKITKIHPYMDDMKSSFWLYTVLVEDKQRFIDWMKEKGVMVSQVHQRNDVHSCFKEFRSTLPNLDQIEKTLVCIPVGWWLSEEDVQTIVNACNSF